MHARAPPVGARFHLLFYVALRYTADPMGRGRRVKHVEPAYLLRTMSNAEAAVQRRLKKDLGVESYAPRYLEYPAGGPVAKTLFECYVFAWPGAAFQAVSRVKGVVGFVAFGRENRVERVPSFVIEGLRAMEGPTGYIRIAPRFSRWSRVRAFDRKTGATSDAVGIVQRRVSRSVVSVLFEILGRRAEMSVLEEDLAAA